MRVLAICGLICDILILESLRSVKFMSVFDHVYFGPNFTWKNKHAEGFIAKKLDRVLINDVWLSRFAHSLVGFSSSKVFNHYPIMIQFEQVMQSRPQLFRFLICGPSTRIL